MEAGESLTHRSVHKIVVESPMPSGTIFLVPGAKTESSKSLK